MMLLAQDLRPSDVGATVSIARFRSRSDVPAGVLQQVDAEPLTGLINVAVDGLLLSVDPDELFRFDSSHLRRIVAEGREDALDHAVDVAITRATVQSLAAGSGSHR